MADDTVIYWVPKDGTMYAVNILNRTYVGISNPERLAAAQRALEFAGIPQKSWTRGEPLTMEEFGTEAVNFRYLMERIEAQGDRAHNTANISAEHASEARRMLGVLLGWSAGQAGSNEDNALAVLRNYQYSCIIDQDTGAWYAVAPGHFWHLKDFNEVGSLRLAHLLSETQQAMNHDQVVAIRSYVLRTVEDVLPVPPPKTYTVQKSDSDGFNAIAKRLGVTPEALKAANPDIKDVNSIAVEQVLNLPK